MTLNDVDFGDSSGLVKLNSTVYLEGNVKINGELSGTNITVADGATLELGAGASVAAGVTIKADGDFTIKADKDQDLTNMTINAIDGTIISQENSTGTKTEYTATVVVPEESLRVTEEDAAHTFAAVVACATNSVLFGVKGGTESVSESEIGEVTASATRYISGEKHDVTLSGLTYNAGVYDTTIKNLKLVDSTINGGNDTTLKNLTLTGSTIYAGLNTTTLTGSTMTSSTIFGGGTGAVDVSDVAMSGSRVYGGDLIADDPGFSGTNNLSLTDVSGSGIRVNGAGRITGNDLNVTDTSTTLKISLANDSSSKAGNVFAGAAVAGTGVTYNAGSVNTTISGGYFSIVGNGSQANSGNLTQGSSMLTISGGTFDGYVYAGAYAQGIQGGTIATANVTGNVELNISGGTFNSYVFGGCASAYNYVATHNTSITGDVITTISGGTFKSAIFGGSQAGSVITGNTKISFANVNLSTAISFGGDLLGGSQNERDFADTTLPEYKKCVSGTRELEFNGSTGALNAKIFNFDTITFKNGASVSFTRASGLNLVDTWNFDVSDADIDLTWNNSVATNNFTGDTINLKGWDTTTTRVFMATNNENLLTGWDNSATTFVVTDETGAAVAASTYEITKITEGETTYKLQIAAKA